VDEGKGKIDFSKLTKYSRYLVIMSPIKRDHYFITWRYLEHESVSGKGFTFIFLLLSFTGHLMPSSTFHATDALSRLLSAPGE
jgi:hypothetical protein